MAIPFWPATPSDMGLVFRYYVMQRPLYAPEKRSALYRLLQDL